jgi:hypothetical protein
MAWSCLAATPVVHANAAVQAICLGRRQASRGNVHKKFSPFDGHIRRDDKRTGCEWTVGVADWHSTRSAGRRFAILRRQRAPAPSAAQNAAGAPIYAIARRAHFPCACPLSRSNFVAQAVRPLRAPPALGQAVRAIEYATDTASPCHWARNATLASNQSHFGRRTASMRHPFRTVHPRRARCGH